MPYASARAAIRERQLRLLGEHDEIHEERLVRESTLTGSQKLARTVLTGLIEAEEAVPGEGEGMWRVCDEYAVVAALEYRPPGGFRAGPPAEV